MRTEMILSAAELTRFAGLVVSGSLELPQFSDSKVIRMQVTIDSTEPLDRVLPVISALYGVSLTVAPDAAGTTAAPAQGRRSRTARPQPRAARRNKRTDVSASAVREWARSNGHQVSDRGRVAAEILDAYRAAH